MFFTDWRTDNPRLARAYMDGTEIYTIVDTSMGLPSGVTLDFIQNRVYWVDAKFDYIETVDYHGKNRYRVFGRYEVSTKVHF